METLDLYVEAAVGVQFDALCLFEIFGKVLLVSLLDGDELLQIWILPLLS